MEKCKTMTNEQITEEFGSKKDVLIHSYAINGGENPDEVMYDDFISRREFINRTGIFISPMHFHLVYESFKKSNVTLDDFICDYEGQYSDCIMETTMNVPFKYEMIDDDVSCMGIHDDVREPNIYEIVDSLAMAYYHKWKYADELVKKYKNIFKELQAYLLKLEEQNKNIS